MYARRQPLEEAAKHRSVRSIEIYSSEENSYHGENPTGHIIIAIEQKRAEKKHGDSRRTGNRTGFHA
ncbi:MAG: hypothetical protein H6R04_288 [Burkholderiaceae bacterium]|nr:hypothetical protein [Burkholderiaceae bacterium]